MSCIIQLNRWDELINILELIKAGLWKSSNLLHPQSICGETVNCEIMHSLSLCVLHYFSTCFFIYLVFGKTVLKNLLLVVVIKNGAINWKSPYFEENNTVFRWWQFCENFWEISALQHGLCSVCHSCLRPLAYINSRLYRSSKALQWEVILAS